MSADDRIDSLSPEVGAVMIDTAMERLGISSLPARGAMMVTEHGPQVFTGRVAMVAGELHLGLCKAGNLERGSAYVTMYSWVDLDILRRIWESPHPRWVREYLGKFPLMPGEGG